MKPFAASDICVRNQTNTMLSNISWKDFIVFMTMIITMYYIIVFFIFYRKDIFYYSGRLFRGSLNREFNYAAFLNLTTRQSLENEIRLCLEEGNRKKQIKEEIMMSLQIILSHYDVVKMSEQKISVNKYIVEQCQNICSIHLDEENADQLWLRERGDGAFF